MRRRGAPEGGPTFIVLGTGVIPSWRPSGFAEQELQGLYGLYNIVAHRVEGRQCRQAADVPCALKQCPIGQAQPTRCLRDAVHIQRLLRAVGVEPDASFGTHQELIRARGRKIRIRYFPMRPDKTTFMFGPGPPASGKRAPAFSCAGCAGNERIQTFNNIASATSHETPVSDRLVVRAASDETA